MVNRIYTKENQKKIVRKDKFGAYGANGHRIPEDFSDQIWCKNCKFWHCYNGKRTAPGVCVPFEVGCNAGDCINSESENYEKMMINTNTCGKFKKGKCKVQWPGGL